MRALIIEDDRKAAQLLAKGLREERFVVDLAHSAEGGDELASINDYDVIILDWLLPDGDGIEVCRGLRARNISTPILMLTARDSLEDRVTGLNTGADDYLVKPFAFEELSARLRALARRGAPNGRRTKPTLAAGPIVLDETARRVTVDGATVDLSPREFSLLECLLRHVGQTLSRDQLLDQAWPFGVAVTPNAVDAYIHYLRDKLGSAGRYIQTIRGVGYRLADA